MANSTNSEELAPVAMQIILHSGNARNLADDAFQAAKGRGFESAQQKMEAAQQEIVLAHNAQTEIVQDEARGTKYEYSPLFAHAQDTLMTVSSEINSTTKMIEMIQIFSQGENIQ